MFAKRAKFGLKQYIPFAISLFTFSSASFAATAYINQIGYRTEDSKEFALVDGYGDVEIADANGTTVLTVTPSAATTWNASGQNVQLVDFSELKTPGSYSIKVGGQVIRSDLNVLDAPFVEVTKASLKWYYYQRASMALEETYAGQWKRPAGHPDTQVSLHSSTGKSGSISSPKGWYDAGDYGKYIVNSGISTYTLLALYEHFPTYFNTLKWNIPAEGSLPDLLAEIKYNLDWMLTMQDADGGVFHKVTTLEFPGDVMPAADKAARYVVGKGTAATFDFAAVMAVAARVYKPFDAAYAEQCLIAAKSAYAWGIANPNVAFSNPYDVATGEYGDSWLEDEKLFAGTELALTTGDASYTQDGATRSVPSWGDVAGLATYEKAAHADAYGSEGSAAKDSLLKTADVFVARAETGFGVVMDYSDFVWGSNAVAANQGVWLLHAYYLTGEKKYYEAATKVLDYLLGKNPLNMSFLTGYGSKSPMFPHHRPSTADRITDPVPGMLVGGPQPGGEDIGSNSWECSDYTTGYPATSYIDNRCSYASNEVAINWNAPFAYLAGAIEALNAGYAPDFAVDGITGIHQKPMVSRKARVDNSARLRFSGEMLFIEKNGKRFNLNGHRIK
ncbi:MAG: glycoside hydrolase family 9 protein [Fibrobacter sp.]|nr:glycoside hydrolase family 9 protein [Fibrobacter sp.]MDY6368492.1 glycoside hydrolase family 9 protein [Fibrobacter sp.]MDY6390191.1 glycoside hydrolase family 9 protein [Fibrobacter sp.]